MSENIKVPAEDIVRVKGLGFLIDKNTGNTFNARVLTVNGKVTTAQMRTVAEAADLFGSGQVTMTTRQTFEIQGVPYANIEPLCAKLAEIGMETGGTGPKVRPVVSCKGTTCQYGLIDTYGLSEKIHVRFYKGMHDVKLPHKFKIAVGGCPNNCVKPELNDIGVIGQRVPAIDLEKCRGCKNCQIEKACPIKLLVVKEGKIYMDADACNHCGRCVGKCPFGAFDESATGYKICIGGRWGKKTAQGRALSKLFTSEEEVLDMIEKIINYYKENGTPGERFADTINRIGFDKVNDDLVK